MLEPENGESGLCEQMSVGRGVGCEDVDEGVENWKSRWESLGATHERR